MEATTYEAGQTGSFTLIVSGLGSTTTTDSCLENLPGDRTATGQWSSDCPSENRSGSYARYYSFTLSDESEVTVTLERTSGDADTYLNLLSGAGRYGSVLHYNDDDTGTTRSRIQETLDAGTYTIEVTTYESGETGSFTLTVSGL